MKKRVFFNGMAIITVLSLAGCGGGGSSTATGYYVDSAIEGVEYTCGSQSGITDASGAFNFEQGSDCQFSLGDTVLRHTDAKNLSNNVQIVEDNIDVARFLQSIDKDGNPDNGIQIPKTVKLVLKENHIKHVPNDDTTLIRIVSELEQQDAEFHGRVKTHAEAEHHVNQTKEEIEKEHHAEHQDDTNHNGQHQDDNEHNGDHQNDIEHNGQHQNNNEHNGEHKDM